MWSGSDSVPPMIRLCRWLPRSSFQADELAKMSWRHTSCALLTMMYFGVRLIGRVVVTSVVVRRVVGSLRPPEGTEKGSLARVFDRRSSASEAHRKYGNVEPQV